MRVQEVKFEKNIRRYMLLDDKGLPVIPVVKYLKYLDNGEIPSDVLSMLWTNHKLNAIDTHYETCLQRTNVRLVLLSNHLV